jgi:hypothetical protein
MSITMNQRTFKVELFQGDDLDRLAELSQAATAAKPSGQSTGTENGDYAAAAEAHDLFLAEAKARAVIVEMQPIPRKAYQTLQVRYPPREDNDGDAMIGANASAYIEPLLKASLVSPFETTEREALIAALVAGQDEPPCPDRQVFLDSLNNAQFQLLADEAVTMNRMVFAPKAPLLGSAVTPSSGETSSSPEPSA